MSTIHICYWCNCRRSPKEILQISGLRHICSQGLGYKLTLVGDAFHSGCSLTFVLTTLVNFNIKAAWTLTKSARSLRSVSTFSCLSIQSEAASMSSCLQTAWSSDEMLGSTVRHVPSMLSTHGTVRLRASLPAPRRGISLKFSNSYHEFSFLVLRNVLPHDPVKFNVIFFTS